MRVCGSVSCVFDCSTVHLLPLDGQVSVVKAKITDEIAMPASKQKLQIGVSCGRVVKLVVYLSFRPSHS